MKKSILLGSVAAMLLFTGCGSSIAIKNSAGMATKYNCKGAGLADGCDLNMKHDRRVTGFGGYSGFTHKVWNNGTNASFQAAAEATLREGDKYFAIHAPLSISNFAGSSMNTAEEFVEKCNIGLGGVITGKDPCGLHINKSMSVSKMTIRMYDERPSDVMTYDAEEVIKYLAKNDLLNEERTGKGFRLYGGKEKDKRPNAVAEVLGK